MCHAMGQEGYRTMVGVMVVYQLTSFIETKSETMLQNFVYFETQTSYVTSIVRVENSTFSIARCFVQFECRQSSVVFLRGSTAFQDVLLSSVYCLSVNIVFSAVLFSACASVSYHIIEQTVLQSTILFTCCMYMPYVHWIYSSVTLDLPCVVYCVVCIVCFSRFQLRGV